MLKVDLFSILESNILSISESNIVSIWNMITLKHLGKKTISSQH